MKRFGVFWTLPVILFVLVGLTVQGADAGLTGKLTGQVVDASGEPLPGVNGVIDGTRRGAMTDADGYYLILSVDPGTVYLVASMVG